MASFASLLRQLLVYAILVRKTKHLLVRRLAAVLDVRAPKHTFAATAFLPSKELLVELVVSKKVELVGRHPTP